MEPEVWFVTTLKVLSWVTVVLSRLQIEEVYLQNLEHLMMQALLTQSNREIENTPITGYPVDN